jgi:hypothetical protein
VLVYSILPLLREVDARAMVRGFSVWEVWMLPVMYTVLRDLRFLAIQVVSWGDIRLMIGG